MVRGTYIRDKNVYTEHYGAGIPMFIGDVTQEGHGLGNILSGLFRTLVPLLTPTVKKIANEAGRNLVRSGVNVAKDVLLEKRDIRDSLKQRGSEGLQNILTSSLTQPRKRRSVGGYRNRNYKRKRANQVVDIFH